MTKKTSKIAFGAVFLLMIIGAVVALVILSNREIPEIIINEVCADNDGEYPKANEHVDAEGDYCDWVELYNPTEKDVSLKGFALSKNGGDEHLLGDCKIGAGEYLLVYCSKSGFEETDFAQADFSIGKTEDNVITLTYGDTVCDEVEVSRVSTGNSCSKNSEGEMYVSLPTPTEENDPNEIGATPTLSQTSGFYADSFDLEITAGDGQKIYYTLDGSDPATSDTRLEYTEPLKITDRSGEPNTISAYDPTKIQLNFYAKYVSAPADDEVDKGTVIKVCAEDSGGCGMTVTAAYFVGLTTADHSNMPVISIVCDADDLYNEETGIYTLGKVFEDYAEENPDYKYNGSVPANYNQKGREWEKSCYFEFFESDGTLQLPQEAGMRIQGGWSRADYQKSFRFYARSSYGKSTFDYAFWGDDLTDSEGNTLDSFKTIVIRNGGNDCNYTKYKDTMFQHMVSDDLFATQEGRFCVLFINGEYWGFYNLEEDYTQEYFSNHYGVAKSDVVTVKNGKLDNGEDQDLTDFEDLCDFIKTNDMSVDSNYRKAESQMDMDSLARYAAMECYIFNTDWPQNNYGVWRTSTVVAGNEYADGRWRFYLFDCESAADHYNTNRDETDPIAHITDKSESLLGGALNGLLDNEEFRQKFVTTLCDMANVNFTYDRYKEFQQKYDSETTDEMDTYYLRFHTAASKEKYVEPMLERMDRYFSNQPEKIRTAIEEHFGYDHRYLMSISCTEGGSVLIDGTEAESDFEGVYYEGCEVTVTAVAEEGYRFVGWESTEDDSMTVTVNGNKTYKAVFVLDTD